MKMTADLDQWLIRPSSTSKQTVSDPLAAFRKMSLSLPESKFCLPSILTSGNNSTWLATRKNDNEMSKSANFSAKSVNVQIANKINQDDNSNWLLKPRNKTETDLVTLTDEKEEPNPWLAQSSVMTTSLDSLPGSFTFPSKFSGELSKDIWLSKPAVAKQAESLAKDLESWLFVPSTIDSGSGAKSSDESCGTMGRRDSNPGLLDEWEKQSLTCNWIVNDSKSSHIEEWLKKALEDDEMDEITDDFDDCSIEVISQD